MKFHYNKNVPDDEQLEQENLKNSDTEDDSTISKKCIYAIIIFFVIFIILINVFDF